MKGICTVIAVLICTLLQAQRTIRFDIRSRRDSSVIPYASAEGKGLQAKPADDSGHLEVRVPGPVTITFSAVGFASLTYRVTDSTAGPVRIFLLPSEKEEAAVVVTSFRTNSRIENLPTRVEVLGSEEVDEETGIKPGNIASLIGDIAGVQIQQASAVSGNVEMRIQGLPGQYTQLLRDGMPLFGAFAGNFSVLQLPPLDLKQIEIVKGSSSTLYGGGAIAGMVNVVTRRPVEGAMEKTILLNQSSLGESNVNLYLSQRRGRQGFTLFAGVNRQTVRDVDGDGYTDLARSRSIVLHPVLYFYPSATQTLSIGYNGNFEVRSGGDILQLEGRGDAQHAFFIRNRITRHSADLQWEARPNSDRRITLKAIGSWLDRSIAANTFTQDFTARQFSYYTELSSFRHYSKHDLVSGINVQGQAFRAPGLRLPGESYTTFGVFVQNDWRLHPKLTLESGFRFDYNSTVQAFPLPRLSLLYRISPVWTARLGGGYGYRVPSAFSNDLDERNYPLLRDGGSTAERAHGANFDVNFHQRIDEADLTINQSFFITSVSRVAELESVPGGLRLHNWPEKEPLRTQGTETYVQLRIDELEAYLGYTFTDAVRRYFPRQPQQPLIARDKFAALLAYEFTDNFRLGIEASHIGQQYREDGSRTPAYFLSAAMIRYDWRKISFVLNCENLFDYRQSREESLVAGGTPQSPLFRELWAPIDGRVVNLSVRIRW
ncbi:TonB-dependent receptor plug domain-containing protein [Flaviaesturariibacter terrae]